MIILRVENNFKSKKEIKQSMKTFLKENKETKPKKKDSKLYYDNLETIKSSESKALSLKHLKQFFLFHLLHYAFYRLVLEL